MQTRNRSGIALISVLLMSGVLLVMVLTLIGLLRGNLFVSQENYSRTAALYLAEGGLAESLAQLEADPSWPGITNNVLPGGHGTYTVEFNSTPPFTNLQSVNNLQNDLSWAASHRGPTSVPPNAALLIVRANVGGHERVLEAMVRRGSNVSNLTSALQSSGTIHLMGDVLVDGIKAPDDLTPVPGNVHSNSAAAGTVVRWDNSAGGTANITGSASAVSPNPGAVDLSGYTPDGGIQLGGAVQPFPSTDIVGTVAGKSASTPVTVSPGTTTLGSGDFYSGGDLVTNGDLVLNGASLFVSGNLSVNGSITGEGSVYVTGETSLQGDARVASGAADNIALFSHGSVNLLGFDGTAYLDSLAASDPTAAYLWEGVREGTRELQSSFVANPPSTFLGMPGSPGWNRFHNARRILGADSAFADGTFGNYPENSVGLLRARLPAGPTADFLRRKFDDINLVFHSTQVDTNGNAPLPASNAQLLTMWQAGTLTGGHGGVFDAAVVMPLPTNPARIATVNSLVNITNQIDYDRLGSSYFRGVIYTNGYLHAGNEVNVIGGVFANGDSSLPSGTVNGVTLNPGDILLSKGTRITFVESFFDGTFQSPTSELSVVTWMGR